MKLTTLFLCTGFALAVAGCDRGTPEPSPARPTGNTTRAATSGRVEWVDPKTIQPGPIQREALTEAQMARVKAIRQTFAEVDHSTLDEFVDGFKRDLNPDRELAIWERMAKAYQRYVGTRNLSLDAKQEVFTVILLRSMASEEDVMARVKLKVLTSDEARTVMRDF